MTTTNPFVYVGQFGVMNTGGDLSLMKNRWYDPTTGRFTQPDPLNLDGGDANLNTYAGNSPTLESDPTGLKLGFFGYLKQALLLFDIYSDLSELYEIGKEVWELFDGTCTERGKIIGQHVGESLGEKVGTRSVPLSAGGSTFAAGRLRDGRRRIHGTGSGRGGCGRG